MRCRPNGFSLIEVLIASVVLTLSLVTLGAAYKQYAVYRESLIKRQKRFVSVLALKDKIECTSLDQHPSGSGMLNGQEYSYKAFVQIRRRNRILRMTPAGTAQLAEGPFEITLYEVRCELAGKPFAFRASQYKKVASAHDMP